MTAWACRVVGNVDLLTVVARLTVGLALARFSGLVVTRFALRLLGLLASLPLLSDFLELCSAGLVKKDTVKSRVMMLPKAPCMS